MGLEMDTAARIARSNGVALDLTDVEFGLLQTLMRSAGEVVAGSSLPRLSWDESFIPSIAVWICT